MTTPLPKRYGYKLPLEALGGVCVKVTIEFPDKLEYRAAYNGAINMLGKWFQWDHTQADYQDIPSLNVEVAQVWSEVLAAAVWEECMSFCEQMIACLTGDEDTQAALRNQLLADPSFLRQMQQQMLLGNKLSPGEITQPVGAQCDRDALWAGCIGMVQQMDRNNTDFLEQIEVLTNPVERATAITSLIPALKVAESAFDFINELVSDIMENYAAEYTSEYENEIACALFCLALSNEDAGCAMSFQDIYDIFRDRLVASFTIESAFNDVIQYLASGTWSGTQVCDFMFMFQLQCINSASKFLTIDLLSLQQMFQVGESEPNTGWTTLCLDCPPEPDSLWIRTEPYGTVTQNSGPTDGSNGHYSFTFVSGQVSGGPNDGQWWSFWVWANKSKKMTVTSVTNNRFAEGVPDGTIGTFGTYVPGNAATEADPLLGASFDMPVTAGVYGGFWCTTFASYPNTFTVEFDLTDI